MGLQFLNDLILIKTNSFVLFENIKKLKILKDFFNIFFQVTGLNLDIIDKEGKYHKIYNPKQFSHFCRIIQSTSDGVKTCINSDKEYGLLLAKKKKIIIYTCHAGMTVAVVPIIIKNEYIGGLGTGPVFLNKHSKKKLHNVCSRIKHLPGVDIKRLKKVFFNMPVISKDKLNVYINLLSLMVNYIIEVEDKILFLGKSMENSAVIRAKMFINENYSSPLTLKEIADNAFLSPYHLAHLFKKETGVGTMQYVARVRLEEAKKLLLDRSRKIIDICYEIGYRSLSHFNRMFKKLIGITPGEYQKSGKTNSKIEQINNKIRKDR